MKRCFALAAVILLAVLSGAHAEDFDEQYVRIFSLIQEADSIGSSQPSQALAKYREAQSALLRIQKAKSDWNAKVVGFRLDYLAAKIAEISPKVPGAATAVSADATNAPGTAAGQRDQPAAPRDWENQLNALKEQISQLQADKGVLEAKLKEALSVQPAESDPRELARAEEKIKALQKENELLKISVEKQKTTPKADPKALELAQSALAEANRQLAEQKDLVARLTQERTALQTRIQAFNAESEAAAALRAENQLLKKQLANTKAASPAKSADAARRLTEAEAQIAALQSDKEILRLERIALENRVKQLSSAAAAGTAPAPASPSSDADRVQQLERERDDLQKKLEAAYKELHGRKSKSVAGRVEELENQLAVARARLEVLEARQVPYSAEELELFNKPAAKLADSNAKVDRKSIHDLSPAAAKMVVEARRYFEAGQYDKAEQSYMEVLREDQKNVPVLANLASIQLEANHLDAAEASIKQALELTPDSAYSLSVLGRLRFRQGKYDEALEALSRAAKLDPQNAEIQNFLGLTLSQKGLRGPAETALRKAIQLEPNYASAHNNLAVIYISQQPPAVELARWHYQKALAAGFPRNANLEKILEERK